jgi:hypothetical protein
MARPGGYDPCHEHDPAGRHLLAKLDARDRVQLVITAYQAGLFDT